MPFSPWNERTTAHHAPRRTPDRPPYCTQAAARRRRRAAAPPPGSKIVTRTPAHRHSEYDYFVVHDSLDVPRNARLFYTGNWHIHCSILRRAARGVASALAACVHDAACNATYDRRQQHRRR